MSWLKQLFSRRRLYNDLSQEIHAHLDEKIEELLATGMSKKEATAAARREFGNLTLVQEDSRTVWRWPSSEDFFADFRYAVRSLRKDRRFAFIAIFALALGIGSSTVIFSVVENVLFDPYPYKDFNRYAVFKIHDLQEAGPDSRVEFSIPEFLEYRAQNHVFEDVVGAYTTAFTYTDHNTTESIPVAYVTANAFEFYGVPALFGRGLSPADGELGAPLVFVMNYKIWKSRFNGDPEILGKSFLLNGASRTLVGIMPPRFQAYGMRIWAPLSLRPGADGMTDLGGLAIHLLATGRLKRGVSLPAAATDIGVIAIRLAKLYPPDYPEHFVVVTQGLNDFVLGDFKRTLYALLAAVVLLLLIACSNVANLLLSRATVREKEIALRAALGATRGRLVRQFLVETFALASAACALGCMFAYFGLKAIVATIPQGPLPDEAVISLNPVVLSFAMLLALLTTLFCGLAPAIHALRQDLQPRLAASGKGSGSGSRHGRLRSAFVVVQVALSIVLLCGAGLMLRSFFALTHVSLGFRPQSLLYAQLFLPKGRYDAPEQEKSFFSQLLSRVKAIPGVIAATEAITVPPLWYSQSAVTVPGTMHAQHWSSVVELCSEEYFQTLDVALVRGRLLSATDIDSVRKVAVVNQTLARNFFGTEDPIGRKIKFNDFDQFPHAPHDAYFEIIGVVTDFRNSGLRNSTAPEAFLPYSTVGLGIGFILAKTAVAPDAVLPSLRQAVWAVDPDAVVLQSGSLQNFLQENAYLEPQFDLFTTAAFASMGLLLVIIGVFSVMAYTVSLQTHEIGIRLALGAQHSTILTMILTKGMRLMTAGILIGLLASYYLSRFIASQIWGVSTTDPLTFIAVVIVVVAVGLTACIMPARRAASVDPLVALRYE